MLQIEGLVLPPTGSRKRPRGIGYSPRAWPNLRAVTLPFLVERPGAGRRQPLDRARGEDD